MTRWATLLLITAALGMAAAPSQALQLTARGDLRVGERSCVGGKVSRESGRLVRGAVVIADTKRAHTNKRGRYELCFRPAYEGAHLVSAFGGESHQAAKKLRAREGAPGEPELSWRPVEMRLRAYPAGRGECGLNADFTDNRGRCEGVADEGDAGPFSGRYVNVRWMTPYRYDPLRFTVERPTDDITQTDWMMMRGWMSGPDAGFWYVIEANLDETSPYGVFRTGTDPSRAGRKEGPLLITVTRHLTADNPDGYTFHVRGWLYKP